MSSGDLRLHDADGGSTDAGQVGTIAELGQDRGAPVGAQPAQELCRGAGDGGEEVVAVKDSIDRYVVHGETGAVNPRQTGTKASVHLVLTVPAGDSTTVRLRLTNTELADPWAEFHQVLDMQRTEAEVLFEGVVPDGLAEDEPRMVRQALAGMLWSKQYHYLDVERRLAEHGVDQVAADPRIRHSACYHMVNDEVISMPDTWEYPWFAAWDLALHAIALSVVDIGFAKSQLELLLRRLSWPARRVGPRRRLVRRW
ncbi:hypothetical protein [Streptomyces sp. NPDC002205]|uniref:hypothetical protein n=1 Tax=Streptomyces sp. NPDC002205 TaxID=3154411 RepID=UPI00331C772B